MIFLFAKRKFNEPWMPKKAFPGVFGLLVFVFILVSCQTMPPPGPLPGERLEEPPVAEEEPPVVPEELPETAAEELVIDMVLIKGGCFDMGDIFGGGFESEVPVHGVCLDDFFLGRYEVTQGLWNQVMGSNRSFFDGCDDCPVEQVSWNEVQRFLERLREITGEDYRLPTEAEWEFAARSEGLEQKWAGTNSEDELDNFAWYRENSGKKTHAVGEKEPNDKGLYDMTGNVWEWTQDIYHPDAYEKHPRDNPVISEKVDRPGAIVLNVMRGGSWKSPSHYARISYRGGDEPVARYKDIGFRLARGAQSGNP